MQYIIWLLFLVACLVPDVRAEKVINIVSPSVSITQDAEQTIKGEIAAKSSIKQISLAQEMFLSEGEKTEPVIIPVKDRKFQAKVILSPGLNIITLQTIDARHEAILPIFLIHPKGKIHEKRLGKASPIVFTSPEGIKFTNPPVIKGVVTDPSIKKIDVVMMNLPASLLLNADIETEPYIPRTIVYKRIVVKNMGFDFPSTLFEGSNVIMAKPVLLKAGIETIQYKVVVYEKESRKISLNEPELEKNRIMISGRVTDDALKQVTIRIYALVEDTKEDKEYIKTMIEKTIKVNHDGTFKMVVPLESNRYTIKSSPTIVVTAGKERATRTLIKWWQ